MADYVVGTVHPVSGDVNFIEKPSIGATCALQVSRSLINRTVKLGGRRLGLRNVLGKKRKDRQGKQK